MMRPFIVMLAAILLTTSQLNAAGPAYSDKPTSQWFRDLRLPPDSNSVSGYNCCDQSDCNNQVEAEWHDGQWWFWWKGVERPVPPNKVVPNTTSIFQKALACIAPSTDTLYCFVKPNFGN